MFKKVEYAVDVEIEYEAIKYPNWNVYKKTVKYSNGAIDQTQGFVLTQDMDELAKLSNAKFTTQSNDFGHFYLMKKAVLEILDTKTISESIDDFYKAQQENCFDYRNDPHYVIVRFSGYDHKLYDEVGDSIYGCMYFDYMHGGMDNSNYYLRPVHDVLAARSDITELKMEAIPHYNRDKDRDRTLSFKWKPSREDCAKIEEYINKATNEYDAKYKAIFDLDLLGLRAGKAAKYESYYGKYESE